MNADVKRDFARMLDARKRLVDVRGERMEQLLAVRALLRALLADFFETLDPITNLRLAELSADGSKSHGDLAVTLSFFEGTKIRLAVDVFGRFSHSVSIASPFDDVERVVEIRVSSDLSRAEVLYEPIGAPATFRTLDLIAATMHVLAHAVASVEAQLPSIPARVAEAPVAVATRPLTVGGFTPRTAAAPRPMVARLVNSVRRAAANTSTEAGGLAGAEDTAPAIPAPLPNADVLTLRLG
ncbi:MAG: hypothetical protein NVS1B2_11970 [Vulcanimicrobiaceae bacterium]